jgi:hypothetical protein
MDPIQAITEPATAITKTDDGGAFSMVQRKEENSEGDGHENPYPIRRKRKRG